MNKYLIVASDERSYLDLKNVVLELKNRNLPYFFLYNDSDHKLYPSKSIEQFKYDTNIEFTDKKYSSKTLGFDLPFKPTVLLITCENWEPEKSIVWEFKQWGCFIGCVENSSWIYNSIKTKLELASRKSFPSNCIDVFFDHSKWALKTKAQAGWWKQKSIVVGNPRYDDFSYKKEKEENIIIVWGSMERELHPKLINIYRNLKNNYKDYKIYYKPHPNEIKEFPEILEEKENINIIQGTFTLDNEHVKDPYRDNLNDIFKKSKYNVGIFSTWSYQ